MTRTKEQDTQYQKDRRARLAQKGLEADILAMYAVEPAIIDVHKRIQPKIIDLGQSIVGGTVREYKGMSGYRYLPGDHVIGNMTQKQRDLIISKLPKTPRAR